MAKDKETVDVEARAAADRARIADLEATIAALKAHVGLVDEPTKTPGYPRHVYRAQPASKLDPKQIDHPGWDTQQVGDPSAFDAAVADGWLAEPGAYVYPQIEESVAVVRRVARA
jgi:hypothetical protein